ncbi:endonuclease [Vibrio sp. D404a]|uniref:endonuclease III domain-containing protein n=1 Tax=unclassified Vibrio TaxID=2614977 RepID=UPI0025576DD5|nr:MULTISPECIES: endonuclease [unclassified Vibrio]MDK9738869.1 endonuclease [Vibrio sp. D404a]MDK9798356.1 endonuclease [Vibrio sp. D449a]
MKASQVTEQDSRLIRDVFRGLEEHYGWFDWWPTSDPYQIMMGAILVQNTNWKNAEKALDNLGKTITPQQVASMDIDELAQAIRSSGYYNQKALKLKAMTQWFAQYDYEIDAVRSEELEKLRRELLAVRGIGGETADAILVYAIGKPSFVIDAYARRIFERVGLDVPKSYETFHDLMHRVLEPDTRRYGYYHGVLVEHGQQFCHPRPKCESCPLLSRCQEGLSKTHV